MNKKITTSLLTRTALLLALTVLVQQIRVVFPFLIPIMLGPFSLATLIIGVLVNLCLIVSAEYTGFFGGLSIAFITPIIAFVQGQLPIPQMIVAVALGNATIVVVYLLLKNKSMVLALAAAAFAKFGMLYIVVQKVIVPIFVSTIEPAAKAEKLGKMLAVSFGFSQLVTAIIGAVLAYFIVARLATAKLKEVQQ